MAITANVAAVIMNTCAMLDMAYTRKMLLSEMPMTALKVTNSRVSPVLDHRWNPMFMARMKPNGASITTQPRPLMAPVSVFKSCMMKPDSTV